MLKSILGPLVGGIIIFMWQFLSWSVIDLHRPSQQYTENQQAILDCLGENLKEEGGYYLPNLPAGSGMEEYEKQMKDNEGKPWALIQYHKSLKTNMGINMVRGLTIDIFIIWMLCWILGRFASNSFVTTLITSLFVGFSAFLFESYTAHIWFETFDLMASFIDAVMAWGLTGVWLGWWLNRS